MNKFDNIDYKVIDDFISNLPFTKSESMLEIYNYAKSLGLNFIETLCAKGCLPLLKLFTPDS